MTNSMRVSLAILGLLAMAGMAKGQDGVIHVPSQSDKKPIYLKTRDGTPTFPCPTDTEHGCLVVEDIKPTCDDLDNRAEYWRQRYIKELHSHIADLKRAINDNNRIIASIDKIQKDHQAPAAK